jgi:hypothetical protein
MSSQSPFQASDANKSLDDHHFALQSRQGISSDFQRPVSVSSLTVLNREHHKSKTFYGEFLSRQLWIASFTPSPDMVYLFVSLSELATPLNQLRPSRLIETALVEHPHQAIGDAIRNTLADDRKSTLWTMGVEVIAFLGDCDTNRTRSRDSVACHYR